MFLSPAENDRALWRPNIFRLARILLNKKQARGAAEFADQRFLSMDARVPIATARCLDREHPASNAVSSELHGGIKAREVVTLAM
jgi:hypothetical protein